MTQMSQQEAPEKQPQRVQTFPATAARLSARLHWGWGGLTLCKGKRDQADPTQGSGSGNLEVYHTEFKDPFFFFLPSHTFFKLSALLTGRQRPQDACRIQVTSNTASAWMHPSSSLATVLQRLLPLLLEPRH